MCVICWYIYNNPRSDFPLTVTYYFMYLFIKNQDKKVLFHARKVINTKLSLQHNQSMHDLILDRQIICKVTHDLKINTF